MIEGIPGAGAYFYYLTTKTRKGFYKSIADEVVSKVEKGKILDIGTGAGNLPIEIAKASENLEIIGIDLSKILLKFAKRDAKENAAENRARFEVGSAYNLSFEDASFDLVISSGVIHHIKYPVKLFNEIYRVLKLRAQAWIYDLITDAPYEEFQRGLKEMDIPPFLSKILLRIHGLKYNEYTNGRIAKAIKESMFQKYRLEKKNCVMKIILKHI